jgi:PPOX class probable F420-dependent enzyme
MRPSGCNSRLTQLKWQFDELPAVNPSLVLPPDIVEFLEQPGQLAVLATVSGDGFPHLTPVWYVYAEAMIWVWMRWRRQKARYLRRHGQAGLYIQACDDIHKGVLLQGTVQLSDDGLAERCLQIVRRYVGAEALQIWHEHMLYGKNTLAMITPVRYARNGSSWNL